MIWYNTESKVLKKIKMLATPKKAEAVFDSPTMSMNLGLRTAHSRNRRISSSMVYHDRMVVIRSKPRMLSKSP